MPFISDFLSWIYIRHYWPNVRSWYMPYVIYSESFAKCWFKKTRILLPFLNNSSVRVTDNFTGRDSNTTWLSPLSSGKAARRKYIKASKHILCRLFPVYSFSSFSPLNLPFMTHHLTFSRLAWNTNGGWPWNHDTSPCSPLTCCDYRHASLCLIFLP